MSDRFREHCRLLRLGAQLVFAGVLLLLVMNYLPSLLLVFSARSDMTGTGAMLPAVRLMPVLGYLWALWAVQSALRNLAAGQLFDPTIAQAMRHIGIGVLCGALLNVFAVTSLSRWIVGGDGDYLYLDVSAIVLGVVGAALVLLAQLVDKARALQTELDGIL